MFVTHQKWLVFEGFYKRKSFVLGKSLYLEKVKVTWIYYVLHD